MKTNLNTLSKDERKDWANHQPTPVLPEDPSLYFELDVPGVRMVELAALRPKWALEENPQSVHRAAVYAHAAAQGLVARRRPLDVRENPDGSFAIEDGTATYWAGLRSGWQRLPVVVLNPTDSPNP